MARALSRWGLTCAASEVENFEAGPSPLFNLLLNQFFKVEAELLGQRLIDAALPKERSKSKRCLVEPTHHDCPISGCFQDKTDSRPEPNGVLSPLQPIIKGEFSDFNGGAWSPFLKILGGVYNEASLKFILTVFRSRAVARTLVARQCFVDCRHSRRSAGINSPTLVEVSL
jgi:hypothetical protein